MQRQKRIWIVSELYYPETTSTGYFLTGVAEGLAAEYPVSAICGQPSYSARGIKAPWRERHNGVDVHRCRSTTFAKDNLIGRAVNLVTASLALSFKALLKVRQGDVVIVVTNPSPALPYLVTIACKLRRSHVVVRVEDVYPEVLTRLKMISSSALSARLMHRASRWLYRSADRTVVLGRDVRQIIAAKLNREGDRIVMISNWGETDTIFPTERTANPLLHTLQLTKRFVVQYCGNIGRTHGVEDLVNAAERLVDEPAIHFLVIGWGAKKKWLLQEKERRGLNNVTVLDPLPEGEFRDGLNACDLALISFSPGMSGVSVPSRMYNVLSAGKPLLAVCDDESELAQVVREEEVGWVVAPGQVSDLVAAIRHAKAETSTLAALGTRARAAAATKYTRAHVADAYRTMVAELWAEREASNSEYADTGQPVRLA